MYGFLLRLDAGRQSRVGTEPLKKLLKPTTYAKVLAKETKLNASRDFTSPFAPTIVRPEFYPSFLRATDIRSIFWRIKNFNGFHDLVRLYVDVDSTLVFEFKNNIQESKVDALLDLLEHHDYFELYYKSHSGNKVVMDIRALTDTAEDYFE